MALTKELKWYSLYLIILFGTIIISSYFHYIKPLVKSQSTQISIPETYDKAYLFIGIDEKSSNVVRGRNDVNILAFVTDTGVELVSFPRETLIYLDERGWRIMSHAYPLLTAAGTTRAIEDEFNIKIDHYYAIDLPRLRKLITNIVNGSPKTLGKLFNRRIKDEYWIRHRKSLIIEAGRQLRIQKYLERFLGVIQFIPLDFEFKQELFTKMIKLATSTSIDTASEFNNVYMNIVKGDRSWSLWPGKYQRVGFAGCGINQIDRWTYVPSAYNYTEFIKRKDIRNPFTYSESEILTFASNGSKLNNLKYLMDWYQDTFIMYTEFGSHNITSNYIPKTNKYGKVSYILDITPDK
jgi:hypothetical protein